MSIVNSVLLCNRVHLQKQKQTEMSTEDSTSLADGSHNLLVSEERLDLVSGISDGMQDTEAGRRPTSGIQGMLRVTSLPFFFSTCYSEPNSGHHIGAPA